MFKKITAMALVGLLTIGTAGISVFADSPTEGTMPQKPELSINFDKDAKAAELAEKQANMEAMAAEFAAKGESFEEVQANMQAKLSESGKTQEEIDALMEKLSTKFDELKAEKGVEVAEKQAEREANMAARAEKGVTRA